jgi:hypothetical protein
MDFLNSLQVTFAKTTTQPNTTSQIDVKMIFLGAAVEGGAGGGGSGSWVQASLISDQSLGATGSAGLPPLLTFFFWNVFSSHKFLFLEYHYLYTQL